MKEQPILDILKRCWSKETSTKWTRENPAAGQCGVTALLVNDHFGGRILKTKTEGLWHFYNEIDGQRHDFTVSQFPEVPEYSDTPSSREEAFEDTTKEQYRALSRRFEDERPG